MANIQGLSAANMTPCTPSIDAAREALSAYFDYEAFRQGQEVLIGAVLAGRDALGIMPTGAGKSLCYQIPGIVLPGLALVVSPLVSLMKDQVNALIDAGVYSGFSRKDSTQIVIKNLLGVAMVLDETGDAPKERVSEMCSPGGVTIEGYKSLIDEGFAKAVMTSVKKAVDKANSI